MAGGEWKLKSYMVNPFSPYAWQPRLSAPAVPFTAELGPASSPVMYTAGQGQLGPISIFLSLRWRADRPLRARSPLPGHSISIWIDSNGDGIQQPEEVSTATTYGGQLISFDVADNGDIYLAMGGHAEQAQRAKVFLSRASPRMVFPITRRPIRPFLLPPTVR